MKKAARRRLGALTLLAVSATLVACSVTPKSATKEEVRRRVQEDTSRMYVQQDPISQAVSLEEAIARTLKYNLDYRLKKMESALALGLSDYANYDQLPNLLATAGYRTRSNHSGGSSIGIDDGIESLRPSSSEERKVANAGAEFSWNLLDFGVSYYRARQQADAFLIAEERRRKVVQNMVQDVRFAWWRALGAQRMSAKAESILERARLALARSREAEAQKMIAPAVALGYQRALLDAITLLNLRRQDLAYAKRELAALMNVEPGVDFVLAESSEAALPAVPTDVRKLEEMALLQRPELREEDFKKRITADDARRQLLSMLPGISMDAGLNHNSNQYLANNDWAQAGVRVSWNLMRLTALPAMKNTQAQQVRTDEARRMSLSMAVMTQVRVSVERYRFALEDLKLTDLGAQVDERLSAHTRASVTARLDSELEAIRTQARAVLGQYQRAAAYANAQVAFGRLYNTLGLDALPDDFNQESLPRLTEQVRSHLAQTEKETLRMSSQLFGFAPSVAIQVMGVEDPALKVKLHAQASELLARRSITVDAQGGIPLLLSMSKKGHGDTQHTTWTLSASHDKAGKLDAATFTSSLPRPARDSAYEASLVSALNLSLPNIQRWLSSAARSTP